MAPTYVRAVLAHLEQGLATYAEAASAAGGRPEAMLGPPELVAERMLAALPEPSPWADVLGPVYRQSQLARFLGGVSRQALADRERRGTLFALRTADGSVVYPAWQLRGAQVLPDLPEVLRALRAGGGGDDWAIAGWLRAGQESLGGASAVEWLAAGGDREAVLVLARDTAARWAR
jgi:hypothetical protein